MNNLSRRGLGRAVAAIAVTAPITAPAIGRAAGRGIRLKLSSIYTPASIQGRTTAKFADLLELKSQGAIKVSLFPNAQLGDETQLLQTALTPGFHDITTLSVVISTTADPAIGYTNLPFLFRDAAHIAAFQASDAFRAQRDALVRSKGLRYLAAWDYPPVKIYTNRPIHRLADMKGLKLRTPPAPQTVQLFRLLGANPTPIPFSELYMALQTGVVEGTNGSDDGAIAAKLTEVTKYVIEPAYQIVFGNPVIAETFYQSLPAELQRAVTDAATEAGQWNHNQIETESASWRDRLKAAGMTALAVEDQPAWQAAVQPLYDDFIAKYGAAGIDAIRGLSTS